LKALKMRAAVVGTSYREPEAHGTQGH